MNEQIRLVDVGQFDKIEDTESANEFVQWMEQQRRNGPDLLIDQLNITPQDQLLDIGCGPGVDLEQLAQRGDLAVGIDNSLSMLRASQERSDGGSMAVVVGDGQALPLQDATFDACLCRAVLIHTPDPQILVDELARVLKPGGRIVLSEPDHGSHLVATDETDVFERIKAHRRSQFRNPLIGRALPDLVTRAELRLDRSWAFPIVHRSLTSARAAGGPFDVAVQAAVEDKVITGEEGERYVRSLVDLDNRGAFLFIAMSIAVTAKAK